MLIEEPRLVLAASTPGLARRHVAHLQEEEEERPMELPTRGCNDFRHQGCLTGGFGAPNMSVVEAITYLVEFRVTTPSLRD